MSKRFLVNPSTVWAGNDGKLTQEGFNQIKDLHNEIDRVRGDIPPEVDLSTILSDISSLDGRVTDLENAPEPGFTWSSEITTTSGTEHDFTDIPAGVDDVLLAMKGVSLSGTENMVVQIGTGASFTTTGYVSRSAAVISSASSGAIDTGFLIRLGFASMAIAGPIRLTRTVGNTWMIDFTLGVGNGIIIGGGYPDLAGEISRVRLTRTGSDTFDAGSFYVGYK